MTDYETQGLIEEARECHQARGWSKDPLVNKLENLANRLANALEAAGAERDAAVAAIERVKAELEALWVARREPQGPDSWYSGIVHARANVLAALDGAPEPAGLPVEGEKP